MGATEKRRLTPVTGFPLLPKASIRWTSLTRRRFAFRFGKLHLYEEILYLTTPGCGRQIGTLHPLLGSGCTAGALSAGASSRSQSSPCSFLNAFSPREPLQQFRDAAVEGSFDPQKGHHRVGMVCPFDRGRRQRLSRLAFIVTS
jgi:hypothetical protein